MNKKQYNNVIDWTLKHDQSAQTEDSLETARTVFKNMGVALPQGDLKQVSDVLKTDDYMGWRPCTMQEAQAAADRGTAAIGVNEEKIVILAANDEEQPVAETAAVMTLSDTAAVSPEPDLAFYSYSYGGTGQDGCGGGESCYHLNSLFDCNNRTALLNELIDLLGNQRQPLCYRTTEECADIVLNYDDTITNYCNLYCVPKQLVQTLIFRELWCEYPQDFATDEAVKTYFRWKDECEDWGELSLTEQMIVPYPQTPAVMLEDCSTGIGQMYALVAINANNLARSKGLITTRAYNKDDWHDCRDVWFNLHNNDEFAIKMTTLEMYHCADYAGVCGSLFHCTESQIKAILSRYNGTGIDAQPYGNECYEYYKIFKKYS